MNQKILFVDDDPNLLDGYKRNLRKDFVTEFALGPEKGLELIRGGEPYAIVVADMRMPGMNGIEFLLAVKDISPDSIRMMLTGNADITGAIQAVNEGNVFRYLTKPCPADQLKEALTAGLAEYEKRYREHEAASTDALTGLNNRKRLEEKLAEENERRKRYAVSKRIDYSIVFIDLDNFKHYNDTFGHPVGDLLLREFAGILKSIMRASDFAARFGGDEFFILMPETDSGGAAYLAERIKKELAQRDYFQKEIEALLGRKIDVSGGKRLSCSIGIASAAPEDEVELKELLKRADDSVLEAKRSGKDCFVIWGRG